MLKKLKSPKSGRSQGGGTETVREKPKKAPQSLHLVVPAVRRHQEGGGLMAPAGIHGIGCSWDQVHLAAVRLVDEQPLVIERVSAFPEYMTATACFFRYVLTRLCPSSTCPWT